MKAGFSADVTYSAYHTIDSHIFGFTVWQLGHAAGARRIAGDPDFERWARGFLAQMRPTHPFLAEHADQHLASPPGEGQREFEFALDLILDGLKRLRRKR